MTAGPDRTEPSRAKPDSGGKSNSRLCSSVGVAININKKPEGVRDSLWKDYVKWFRETTSVESLQKMKLNSGSSLSRNRIWKFECVFEGTEYVMEYDSKWKSLFIWRKKDAPVLPEFPGDDNDGDDMLVVMDEVEAFTSIVPVIDILAFQVKLDEMMVSGVLEE